MKVGDKVKNKNGDMVLAKICSIHGERVVVIYPSGLTLTFDIHELIVVERISIYLPTRAMIFDNNTGKSTLMSDLSKSHYIPGRLVEVSGIFAYNKFLLPNGNWMYESELLNSDGSPLYIPETMSTTSITINLTSGVDKMPALIIPFLSSGENSLRSQ